MNVNLHIESLVLDGLPIEPGHVTMLQASIETELTRLVTEGGFVNPGSGIAVPSVRADTVQVGTADDHAALGRQVAGSIYGSLGKHL